ncbi:XRE family transcriptional regulator [Kiloniella spongiae]|uniref:XRE family transcriptional regulator n=1 Tax=Kiloniella spongiae TaxID=1489064 RepID=A0A0H2MHK1_9PROT|nr:helix-turn-helix transcriptional regulator [Kiloniella spongiae]KLN61661.1 XRE family transcriptional regulator [Kiloniella spongiae]
MKQLIRTPKDMGRAIREARKDQKLTQKELAVKSGVWQETISKLENGAASTKLETLFDLIAALDLEVLMQTRSKGETTDMDDLF